MSGLITVLIKHRILKMAIVIFSKLDDKSFVVFSKSQVAAIE